MNENYIVLYNCYNCNHSFKMQFDFGVEASDKEDCPNCGVWGAKKSTVISPYTLGIVIADKSKNVTIPTSGRASATETGE